MHPEIPLSTIKYTLRKESERENNVSKPRSGGPKKLSEEQRQRIYDLTRSNPNISRKELLASVEHAIKERSLRSLLRDVKEK